MSQQPFGDIPLFRELEKLLAASEGPFNAEIARQVAEAMAAQIGPDPGAEPGAARAYADSVRNAETLLAGYTRLQVDEPALSVLLTRSQWTQGTLDSWRWVLEHLAARFTAAMDDPAQAEVAAGQQALIAHVVPLLMGLQAGTLIGHLSHEALGRYDLPIPRDDDGRLFLVHANTELVAAAYGFDGSDLQAWLALRESARHLVVSSTPWAIRYLRSALIELVDSIELDLGDMEKRLMDLQTEGVEALQGLRSDQVLPVVQTPRHAMAHDRLQAFVAVFEGYATHAAQQVGSEVIADEAKIAEGMSRREASPSEGKTALTSMLGLALDRSQRTAGVTFCAAVVDRKGIDALNALWDAPDNLPSLVEIRDPFEWIDRVLEAR